MYIDANTFPDGHEVTTDVCIVGGGVAGLSLAREFIGDEKQVCILEQGRTAPDEDAQELLRGSVVGYPYWALDYARHAQIGGTSHTWFLQLPSGGLGARFRPMDAVDFEAREGVPYSGWPITRAEMDPYYVRAQRLFELGPYTYDVSEWADPSETWVPESEVGRTVIFQYGSRNPFTDVYPGEIEAAENVTLYYNSHVLSLDTDSTGSAVSEIRAVTPGGRRFVVRARLFVLAAGGIENARLLLLSNERHSAGLGNQNDLVGRFFMEHSHFESGHLWPSDPSVFERQGLYFPHVRDGTVVQGKLALNEEVLRDRGLRNFSISLRPTWDPGDRVYRSPAYQALRVFRSTLRSGYLPDGSLELVRAIIRDAGGLVRHLGSAAALQVWHRLGLDTNPVAYRLHHFAEQAPNPDSRVRLSRRKTDPHGQPLAELDLRVTEDDIRNVLAGQKILMEDVERRGLGHFEEDEYDQLPPAGIKGGGHHMGTTRMHRSAHRGVVDPSSRVHGINNLYVAGPSVFPTGGCANPVLTLCALTLRLADHIKTIGVRSIAAKRGPQPVS